MNVPMPVKTANAIEMIIQNIITVTNIVIFFNYFFSQNLKASR
jgi:hypothetical protein